MQKKIQTIISSPPVHLSDRAKDLWRSIAGRKATTPERLALLQSALEALDRCEQARDILGREGLTIVTSRSGVPHAHPLVKVERDNRAQFARLWDMLGLRFDRNI